MDPATRSQISMKLAALEGRSGMVGAAISVAKTQSAGPVMMPPPIPPISIPSLFQIAQALEDHKRMTDDLIEIVTKILAAS